MERRSYLRSAWMAASVMLAGCSTQRSGPTPSANEQETTATASSTTSTPPTATKSTTESPSHIEGFRNYLISNNTDIEFLQVQREQNIVLLEYVTEKSSYDELGAEIGMIAGGFFRGVSEGWGMKRLDATVLNAPGEPLATWFAKASWFAEFEDGEITGEELSLRVLNTLEPVE